MKFSFFLSLLLLCCMSLYPQDTVKLNYRRYDNTPLKGYIPSSRMNYYPLNMKGINSAKLTELNPRIPRVDYLGVHFINKDTGWACGSYGAVIKTTNGGVSWNTSNTPTAEVLLKIRSFDGNIVLSGGFNGIMLRSTDGGNKLVLGRRCGINRDVFNP
jgi:hypothetical protein